MENKKISQLQEKTSILSANDLLYVSEAQPYNRFGSRYVKYGNFEQSMRNTFDYEINLLNYINETYIDGLVDEAKIEVIGGRKYIMLYFTTTRGKQRIISVDLQDVAQVYSAGEGLCCNDRVFSVDYDYVAHKQHSHELADLNNISVLSSEAVSYVQNQILTAYYKSSETSSATELDTEFEKYQIKGNYLTADALNNVSSNWNTAYQRISSLTENITANIGSIGYKNSLSTSDIQGYKDTTYSNGFGLSLENNVFGVDTDKIAVKDHNHDSSYYKKSETSSATEINDKFSELKGLAYKEISDIVDGSSIIVVDNKLSSTAKGGGSDLTYDYVKTNLSNDGYGLKVIFRDWSYE